jgi:hypothetical protein
MTGAIIPQSTALAEAGAADSLAELMNRQPPYDEATLDKLIQALRAQRVKWQAAEAASPGKSAAGPKASNLLQSSPKAAEDLGL